MTLLAKHVKRFSSLVKCNVRNMALTWISRVPKSVLGELQRIRHVVAGKRTWRVNKCTRWGSKWTRTPYTPERQTWPQSSFALGCFGAMSQNGSCYSLAMFFGVFLKLRPNVSSFSFFLVSPFLRLHHNDCMLVVKRFFFFSSLRPENSAIPPPDVCFVTSLRRQAAERQSVGRERWKVTASPLGRKAAGEGTRQHQREEKAQQSLSGRFFFSSHLDSIFFPFPRCPRWIA